MHLQLSSELPNPVQLCPHFIVIDKHTYELNLHSMFTPVVRIRWHHSKTCFTPFKLRVYLANQEFNQVHTHVVIYTSMLQYPVSMLQYPMILTRVPSPIVNNRNTHHDYHNLIQLSDCATLQVCMWVYMLHSLYMLNRVHMHQIMTQHIQQYVALINCMIVS